MKILRLLLLVSILSACQQKHFEKLYISDFGVKPGTGENAIPFIQKAIEEARQYDSAIIYFEPGRYDFYIDSTFVKNYYESNTSDNNPKNLGILIKGCKNIVIEGSGSELIFHGPMQPISIDSSEQIVIRNLNIDWDIPLTAQGKVLETSEKHIDLEIDTVQFPYLVDENRLIFVGENWRAESRWFMEYEAETHLIAAGTGDPGCVRGDWDKYYVKTLQPGKVRMHGEFIRTPAIGNYLILRHSPRDHAGVLVIHSDDIQLENINIYHCAGLGVLSQFSKDLYYNNVNFIPNKAKNRYISGHDDGFQVSNCGGMVSITNCEFGGLMDDPINVHGTSVRIVEKTAANKLKCRFMHHQSSGMLWGRNGDKVGFIENESMQTVRIGIVKNFEIINKDEFFVEFENNTPMEIEVGDALENLTWSPELEIKDCTFGSCRARGLLVTTPGKVMIENNIFESSGSAILIAGDANYWYESGAVTDVTIRKNTFKDACMTSMYQFCEGIISIYPEIPVMDSTRPFHRNIRIEENTFHAFDYPILYAKSVDGLTFSNNQIIHSEKYEPFHYRRHNLTMEACKNVSVLGNRFSGDVLGKNIRMEKMDSKELKADSNWKIEDQ